MVHHIHHYQAHHPEQTSTVRAIGNFSAKSMIIYGDVGYVPCSGDNKICVIDLNTNTVLKEIGTQEDPVEIIAEGIETEDQLDAVIGCGCRNIQGFYISRPMNEINTLDFINSYMGPGK